MMCTENDRLTTYGRYKYAMQYYACVKYINGTNEGELMMSNGENGDSIYIGADLPDEYTGSKYTEGLKGTNAKAKANASQGIPELLSIATGKHYRTNMASKHKRDAKFGWYRYDSRFALPVYDENGKVERYNVFHASMIIRHGADSRLYLYDIIDIKKETSNPLSS